MAAKHFTPPATACKEAQLTLSRRVPAIETVDLITFATKEMV
jgi:hypothetical protein